jgi:hypothetical protein
MLGSDKSRGYCLEMICADFLAGAALETGGPEQNSGGPTVIHSSGSEQTVSTETRRNE